MSSQAFAIIYLHELDSYIVEVLKPILYLRYNDDGLLISDNKEYLKYCLKAIKKIIKKYKLKLNNKTRIYSMDEGFEFLGFKYIRKDKKLVVKVKNQTKKRFKRRMKTIHKMYLNDDISLCKLNQIKNSCFGHLKYGNTKNLIKKTVDRYEKVKYYDLGNRVKIMLDGTIIISKNNNFVIHYICKRKSG